LIFALEEANPALFQQVHLIAAALTCTEGALIAGDKSQQSSLKCKLPQHLRAVLEIGNNALCRPVGPILIKLEENGVITISQLPNTNYIVDAGRQNGH
jgi:hypothetical protein